jgi:hypothetical protein
VITRVDFGDRIGIVGGERGEQFFRLALELIEVRVRAEFTSREMLLHNELVSWLRRHPYRASRQPLHPVSARSGRKEFIARYENQALNSGGRSPSRAGTVAACDARGMVTA